MTVHLRLSADPVGSGRQGEHPLDVHVSIPTGEAPPSGFPAILFCPGLRGNTKVMNEVILRYFSDHGYITAVINYTELQPNRPEHAWVRPLDRVHEAVRALQLIAHRDDVDGGRLGIYGISYGGPVAICAASLAPEVRAVVSVAGPGNGWRMMRSMRTRTEWSIFIAQLEEDRRRQEQGEPPIKVSLLELMPFSEHYQEKMVRLQDQLGLSQQDDNESKYFLETAFHMLNFHPEQAAALLQHTPLLQICGDQDECATREQIEEISDFASCESTIRWIDGGTDHLDLHVSPGREKQLGFAVDWFDCYVRPA